MTLHRMTGRAEVVLASLPRQFFDLIVTSPPAYPSPKQKRGSLGTESNLEDYVQSLGRVLFRCRGLLRDGGVLCLVIEPLQGFNVMEALRPKLQRLMFRMLATYRWSHGDGGYSWLIFLGKGKGSGLNHAAPAWKSQEWLFPRPPPDAVYGFYEWPPELIQAITSLTIPTGGRILDPYAGKAQALSQLGPEFEVVAVDVLAFDDETTNPDESRMAPVADAWRRRRELVPDETQGVD